MKKYILEYEQPDYEKDKNKWEKIVCKCGCDKFEIIYTGDWETSAKCSKCGLMDCIHSG